MRSGAAVVRAFVRFACAAAAMVAAGSAALAQPYPSQDLHFISGFGAGSGADVLVRHFAEKVRGLTGRTVVVENKAGMNGGIAIEYMAKAKPDGYTVMVHAGSGIASNMYFYKNPPVDVTKALRLAATINRQAFMLCVDATSPYQTVAQLTQAMKAKGEAASYATSSTTSRIMGEMYKQIAGITAVEVPYKLAQDSLNDMRSGRIDFAPHDPVFALSQRREGRLRILAIASGERLKTTPDIPTMQESGVSGMDLVGWWSVAVPAATPRPIVEQLNAWFNQILATEDTKAFLNKFGGDPFISTPDAAQALLEKEVKAWGDYVKIAKIEPQ
jgi:tripartite-type tricarboxylate transporter receptor subunit TctC